MIDLAGLSQELEGFVFISSQFCASALFLPSRDQPQTWGTPLSQAAVLLTSGSSLARLDERRMSSGSLQSRALARRTNQLCPSTPY